MSMRRKDREITDITKLLEIVDEAKVLHLGLLDEGYPYIVPLHYGYVYEQDTLPFYMHSAKEGLKLLMRHQTGREFDIDGKMAGAAAVIRVRMDEITAKARPAAGK